MTEPRYVWIRDTNRHVFVDRGLPTEEGHWVKEAYTIQRSPNKTVAGLNGFEEAPGDDFIVTEFGRRFELSGEAVDATKRRFPGITRCVFTLEEKNSIAWINEHRQMIALLVEGSNNVTLLRQIKSLLDREVTND